MLTTKSEFSGKNMCNFPPQMDMSDAIAGLQVVDKWLLETLSSLCRIEIIYMYVSVDIWSESSD